jgi:hypothetical protein
MPEVVAYPDRRTASLVVSTENVPPGTLLNVPSAPPSGAPSPAPIVAVNTTHWYQDAAFLSAATGALLALSEPIVQALQAKGAFNWRSFSLGCILAIVAWLRNRTNTVLK